MTYGFIKKTLSAYGIDIENLGGGSGTPGPLTAAIRQVGTNCTIPTYQDSGTAAFMSASVHTICDDMTSIAIETPWFYINSAGGFAEAGAGSTATIAAWLEFPRGVYTQFLYSGNATGSIPSGTRLQSDYLTVRIPRFAQVRIWHRVISGAGRVLNQAGTIGLYTSAGFANGGEGLFTSGVTGSSVPPAGGFGNNTASTTVFRPCAILGTTTRRSMFVKGDSRVFGIGDGRTGGYPDVGEINRSLGGKTSTPVAYISAGTSGDSLGSFIAAGSGGRTNQIALAAYCTDNLPQIGINDIIGGAAPATIQTQYGTYKSYFPATQTFWLSTKPPVSTSTDSWATTANQTTHANNANRNTMNAWYRSFPSGWAGCFDVTDPVESDRNSGLWRANGTAFAYTSDGTHLSVFGNEAVMNSGVINTTGIQ